MKNLLRIEEALMFGLAIYLNSYLPFAAWIFWALFLLPDMACLDILRTLVSGPSPTTYSTTKGLLLRSILPDISSSFMNLHLWVLYCWATVLLIGFLVTA